MLSSSWKLSSTRKRMNVWGQLYEPVCTGWHGLCLHPSEIQPLELRLIRRPLRPFAGDHAQHERVPCGLFARLWSRYAGGLTTTMSILNACRDSIGFRSTCIGAADVSNIPATVCRVAQLERSIGTAISIVTSNIDHAMALSGSASNLCPHFRTLPTLIVSATRPPARRTGARP